jgi:hypothetical protein
MPCQLYTDPERRFQCTIWQYKKPEGCCPRLDHPLRPVIETYIGSQCEDWPGISPWAHWGSIVSGRIGLVQCWVSLSAMYCYTLSNMPKNKWQVAQWQNGGLRRPMAHLTMGIVMTQRIPGMGYSTAAFLYWWVQLEFKDRYSDAHHSIRDINISSHHRARLRRSLRLWCHSHSPHYICIVAVQHSHNGQSEVAIENFSKWFNWIFWSCGTFLISVYWLSNGQKGLPLLMCKLY